MNVVLWIVAAILAAVFLAAGGTKLSQPKSKLAGMGMGWTEDFNDRMIKVIGTLEVLAAIGLILPAVLNIAPVLVPLAATGLALVMLGAIVVHARRHESPLIIVNVVLLALAVFVAWGRFGTYAF